METNSSPGKRCCAVLAKLICSHGRIIQGWIDPDPDFLTNEGVHRIRPQVTFDVRSNSPFISQVKTRKFGRRF